MATFKFIGEDFERTFVEVDAKPHAAPTVEIITSGLANLVFINGMRVGHVLQADTSQPEGEICPQVTLKLHVDKLTVRAVDREEWKRLAG